MSNSTVTIQQVVNYAQQKNALMPLTGVGGIANEPALSMANDTLTLLFADGLPWKFNRQFMSPLVTCPNKQDYLFAGACAFVVGSNYPNGGTVGADAGGVGIDLISNNAITLSTGVVTVKLLESCLTVFNVGDTVYLSGVSSPGIAAVYTPGQGNTGVNSVWSNGFTIASIATDGKSFTFSYAGSLTTSPDGAPGITNLAWLESATMTQTASTSVVPYVWYLQGVRTLEPAAKVGIPDRVSILQDLGTGVLKIRFRYLPSSQPFTVSLVYQAKPPLVTSLSQTWAPFPDNLIHVIRAMFNAQVLDYAASPKFDDAYQKAIALAQATTQADDREEAEEYITPDQSIMSGFGWGAWDW